MSGSGPMTAWSVLGRARLDSDERAQVGRLRAACEAAEHLDLKLELDEAEPRERPIHFLAVEGDQVIGYAGITATDEAEVCGMVHPSWRQQGIGTALLDGARDAAASLERQSILVICEDAGPVAIAWMQRLGATLDSAERRMILPLAGTAAAAPSDSLETRLATDDDHGTVVAILGEEYSDYPDERRLVAIEDGTVVGTLRLTGSPRRTMIYGFVIDEHRRGRRLGTRILATVIHQLRAEGVAEVGLEVDPENTPAVRLYERYGFKTVTTYRYMSLAVTQPAHLGPSPVPERRAGAPSPEA
jgi:ribosomal protein S18 acetylase RimI-like enzyme